ncbi:prefoldin subunit 6 [Biomphalaria glabrata]|uniref:Prefoldin subunit 6-like n=2 Tax=Biomphalaria TaxID=6525 RepID=A0A2C9K460_BIOGL|nr:prefoldin subunit 6-like [Biomphalaria glabrata]KAI8748614.1 prefoldin subunit 6-like [Biomphalaria glabrata]KAI8779557.1 prefoldin subunit 6 [Biomphalaria glabrata]KAK0065640.1 prefoldin subunit 6 [Biomphalaria pfeifferi]
MADGLQKRLQNELDKFQSVQKDVAKHIGLRQQLEGQLSENSLVKEELDRLEDGAGVFKMVGPALIKQDLSEAKQNVQKRIDYINGELKRHDNLIKELEKKAESHRDSLNKLQHQFQQAQVKAAAKS